MVLDPVDQFAAFEQPPDIAGRRELSFVGADQVDLVAERLDAAIERIEGSFYNVMGLPIQKVYTELDKFLDS